MTIVSAVLGMGWLDTVAGWYRDRAGRKQRTTDYLIKKRQDLDARPDLLQVGGLLRLEAQLKREGKSEPSTELSGQQLRDLPAFFEDLWPSVQLRVMEPRDVGDAFGEEILLCHRSTILWKDDGYRNTYWSSFRKLASAVERAMG